MNMHVLVTYATKHGATAEIADKIGDVLSQEGILTDLFPVNDVVNLHDYTAVILGSAVYAGQWRQEAINFLKTHEQALAERDVWLFSSGPTGEGDAEELLKGWRFPEKYQPLADRIHPHEIAVFHGELDVKDLNFIERFIINRVKAPVGDFRDWDDITEWATAVAHTLKQSA